MTPQQEQRHSEGRRLTDGHCDMHHENTMTLNQNTVDLAGIKSQNKVLGTIAVSVLTVGTMIVGYYVQQMDKTMDKLADNMAIVQNTVASNQLATAINQQKLDALERNVQMLTERRK